MKNFLKELGIATCIGTLLLAPTSAFASTNTSISEVSIESNASTYYYGQIGFTKYSVWLMAEPDTNNYNYIYKTGVSERFTVLSTAYDRIGNKWHQVRTDSGYTGWLMDHEVVLA